MQIVILCVGKKHDPLIASSINDYTDRLERSVSIRWELVPPSGFAADKARDEETKALIKRIRDDSIVCLLDETGEQLSSTDLAKKIAHVQQTGRNLVFIIGGAYGVSSELIKRADFVWSLSKLVFPHQIVRLIVAEQLYRAYEINRGSGYHHV